MNAWLTIAMLWAFAPPLSEAQQRDLATARDDGEYREQAFLALTEHVRDWPPPSPGFTQDDAHAISLKALRENPQAHRGAYRRITGELLQTMRLAPPYEDVVEWFVRDTVEREPVIVFVVGEDVSSFSERALVAIHTVFYKRMRFTARDGRVRTYAAFVGRFPQPVTDNVATRLDLAASSHNFLAAMVLSLAALAIIFIAVRIWAQRGRQTPIARRGVLARDVSRGLDPSVLSARHDLPDDPAAALAELQKRAGNDE